jgi:hypothetical protein
LKSLSRDSLPTGLPSEELWRCSPHWSSSCTVTALVERCTHVTTIFVAIQVSQQKHRTLGRWCVCWLCTKSKVLRESISFRHTVDLRWFRIRSQTTRIEMSPYGLSSLMCKIACLQLSWCFLFFFFLKENVNFTERCFRTEGTTGKFWAHSKLVALPAFNWTILRQFF